MQHLFDALVRTADRLRMVAAHGISPDEVEEAVLYDRRSTVEKTGRGGRRRYRVYGRTEGGRMIMVVLVPEWGRLAGPITARDVNDNERRRYFHERP